ncbi:hypothetical protein C5Y93_01810 [Blastopirellula marina]|uniref:Leucine-rich repeat domain-containing protein n=2 Tax=Blastopirellula marina TaxID=124 RepID=A0A2S8GTQ7_9BACT|nr:hypothetical protein C5Y93_01810 [Blastopirellula marina]
MRAMLGVILLICLFLGWIGRNRYIMLHEAAIVASIVEQGGTYYYHYNDPIGFADGRYLVDPQPPGYQLLRSLFGDHLFARVGFVKLPEENLPYHAQRLPDLRLLESVSAENCQLTDDTIEALRQIPRLHKLIFHTADLKPEQFRRLSQGTRIERLWLAGPNASLEYIQELPYFSHLTELRVTNGSLAGNARETTDRLTQLKRLFIDPNQGSEAIEAESLRKLTNLEELYLWDSPLDDDHMQAISSPPKLRILEIWDDELSDDQLAPLLKLKQLDTLYLNCQAITTAGIKKLKQIESLSTLSIPTHISEQDMAEIGLSRREEGGYQPDSDIRSGANSP